MTCSSGRPGPHLIIHSLLPLIYDPVLAGTCELADVSHTYGDVEHIQ